MRNIKGQVYFDSLAPEEETEIICGPEDCEDCNLSTLYGKCTIGKEFATDDDLAEAADELATERITEQIHFDAVAEKMRKQIKEIEEGI